MLKSTQVMLHAIDLHKKNIDYVNDGENAPLVNLDISEVEKHGTINHCVSVYNAENDRIESGLSGNGPRIINFANILKHDYLPLANIF
jgi:hypothetical protein